MWDRWLLGAFVVFSAVLAPAGPQAGDDLKSEVAKLLELGDKRSAKALKAVEDQFQSRHRSDPRLGYAYAIVMVRQGRMHAAAMALDEVLMQNDHDLAARRAYVWVTAAMNQRAAATAALTRFSDLLARDVAKGKAAPDYLDSAALMGRIMAYLALKPASKQARDDLGQLSRKMVGKLTPPGRREFEQGETEVRERHARLEAELARDQRTAKKQASRKLEKARSEQSQQDEALTQEEDSLENKLATRAEKLESEVGELDDKLKKLDQARETLENRISPLAEKRLLLVSQLLPETVMLTSPNGYARLVTDSLAVRHNVPIRLTLGPIEQELIVLGTKLTEVEVQIESYTQNRDSAVARHEQGRAKAAVKGRELDRKRVRLERAAKKTKPKATGNTAQVRSRATHLAALSSVFEFPFDQEKERLLATFQNASDGVAKQKSGK